MRALFVGHIQNAYSAAHNGIVHEHIDATEGFNRTQECGDIFSIRDIGSHCDHLVFAEFGTALLSRVIHSPFVDVAELP
jgi:hypothetical protein